MKRKKNSVKARWDFIRKLDKVVKDNYETLQLLKGGWPSMTSEVLEEAIRLTFAKDLLLTITGQQSLNDCWHPRVTREQIPRYWKVDKYGYVVIV